MGQNNLSDSVKVVTALAPQSIAQATAITTTNIDVRGFRWALVVLEVFDNIADGVSTFTIQSSPTSGGSYADMEDDTFNLTSGGTANATASMTVAAAGAGDGVQLGEIDLDQFDGFLEAVYTTVGTGATEAQCTIILSGADNGKESISNTLTFQLLTADKAAY